MAKSKKGGDQNSATPEQFQPDAPAPSSDTGPDTGIGDADQYDPESAAAATQTAGIAEASNDVSICSVSTDLLDARDALISQLGGDVAFAEATARAATDEQFGLENIIGVGVGLKESAGGLTGDLAVKVYVREKLPLSRVNSAFAVAETMDGVPTDVEEVGEIVAQSYSRRYSRPVPCGVSCGHVRITAGTIGCLVVLNNNRLCLLSNNHVLANENDARQGDPIIQPGTVDSGHTPQDLIGVLERFEPISFSHSNAIDAAAAWTNTHLVSPRHVTYRLNPEPLSPANGMTVIKNGRTSQATAGVVTGLHINNLRVGYRAGVATFHDQIVIQGIGGRAFSRGGDSGSIIATAGSRQPVALLFAGSNSGSHTFANPIGAVMSGLGIRRFVGG